MRKRFAERLVRVHGVERSSQNEMLATIGAKQGVYFALLAILEPMDEVIVIDPCWVTYAPSVTLAGGRPVPIPLGPGNTLDTAAIGAAIGERTRAIIINTPHNPTGRVFTESELSALAALVRERGLWLICDESFDLFVFDGNKHFSPGVFDAIRDQTILLYSFSKAFAMPSHRIGMLVGPEPICRLVATCTIDRRTYATMVQLQQYRSMIVVRLFTYDYAFYKRKLEWITINKIWRNVSRRWRTGSTSSNSS